MSSQLVSTPRINRSRRRPVGRRAPHDQGVLTVVVVVGAPAPRGAKAEALVHLDRGAVRGAHLQRVLLARAVGQLEQALDERGGDALAAEPVVDRHVHQVPHPVVAGADQVADQPIAARRGQADPGRLAQLQHEHRQRPGSRERATLDRDHAGEVGVGQAADVGVCVIGALRREVAGSRGSTVAGGLAGTCAPVGTRSARGPRGPAPVGSTVAPAASRRPGNVPRRYPRPRGRLAACAARSGDPCGGRQALLSALVEGAEYPPRRASIGGRRSGPSIPSARARSEETGRSSNPGYGQRPRGGHADAQAGERPRPHPHRHGVDVGPGQPGLLHRRRHAGSSSLAWPAGRRSSSAAGTYSKLSPSARSTAPRWRPWRCRGRARSASPSTAAGRRRDARGAPAPPHAPRRLGDLGPLDEPTRSGVR